VVRRPERFLPLALARAGVPLLTIDGGEAMKGDF
jgi:hypothetical protein